MDFRILIHSRDAQMYLLLQHVLAVEGFSVSPLGGLDEARTKSDDPDARTIIIVCSDAQMDHTTLRALKASRPKAAIVHLGDGISGELMQRSGEIHADLVLTRPFDPLRLVVFLRRLRLDALIEAGAEPAEINVLRFADLELNSAAARVRRNGHDVPLTALQFRLLRHLMRNPMTIQSREALIAVAWSEDADVEPRTVDIHIGHIRRALRKLGPDLIRTVRTRGYALDAEGQQES